MDRITLTLKINCHIFISPENGDNIVNFKNVLLYIIALAIVAAVGYFFYLQFKNNIAVINTYHFTANPSYIFASVVLGSFCLFIGPLVWRIYVNYYIVNKLNIAESFALYFTSAMFKYIPGKVWTYAAQIALLSSKGISAVVLVYINAVSSICFVFIAAGFVLYYYLFCVKVVSLGIAVALFVSLIVLDIVFIVWNDSVINYVIKPLSYILKVHIQPVKTKKIIFVYTQLFYTLAYIIAGAALYLLARGINMAIPLADIFAVMSAISISTIVGLMAFFTVGGLGVREGTMFFLLKQFLNIETALILPIVVRLLTIIVELIMLILALMIGLKYGYFYSLMKSSPRQELRPEE